MSLHLVFLVVVSVVLFCWEWKRLKDYFSDTLKQTDTHGVGLIALGSFAAHSLIALCIALVTVLFALLFIELSVTKLLLEVGVVTYLSAKALFVFKGSYLKQVLAA